MGFMDELKKLTQPYDDDDDFFEGASESERSSAAAVSAAQMQFENAFGEESGSAPEPAEKEAPAQKPASGGGLFGALGARRASQSRPRNPLRERTVNFGASIVKYYDIQKDDVVIFFHNIGVNPATIDAAMEVKKRGAKLIAVASSYWQNEMPQDHFIRHPSGKNLFDFADVCIDDYNPVGDAIVNVPGLDTPIAPVSNIVDFTIAHLLEIETVRQCVERGIVPPVWNSANAPGGDEKNAAYLAKYKPRIKML
jgi:uncharacterized phosphosugar-binding protein